VWPSSERIFIFQDKVFYTFFQTALATSKNAKLFESYLALLSETFLQMMWLGTTLDAIYNSIDQ